jgi:hypothetical protein
MSLEMSDLPRALALDLPPERLAETVAAFLEIRAEIAKLHALDLGETQPAVIFRPFETPRDGHGHG